MSDKIFGLSVYNPLGLVIHEWSSPEELARFMAMSGNRQAWFDRCDEVVGAFWDYPVFWKSAIVDSGLEREMFAKFDEQESAEQRKTNAEQQKIYSKRAEQILMSPAFESYLWDLYNKAIDFGLDERIAQETFAPISDASHIARTLRNLGDYLKNGVFKFTEEDLQKHRIDLKTLLSGSLSAEGAVAMLGPWICLEQVRMRANFEKVRSNRVRIPLCDGKKRLFSFKEWAYNKIIYDGYLKSLYAREIEPVLKMDFRAMLKWLNLQ